jgi:Translationally controlled tumour protein
LQYVGESMNPEGMVALLNYREDGITRKGTAFSYYSTLTTYTYVAYFTFWKDGLKEVKL